MYLKYVFTFTCTFAWRLVKTVENLIWPVVILFLWARNFHVKSFVFIYWVIYLLHVNSTKKLNFVITSNRAYSITITLKMRGGSN